VQANIVLTGCAAFCTMHVLCGDRVASASPSSNPPNLSGGSSHWHRSALQLRCHRYSRAPAIGINMCAFHVAATSGTVVTRWLPLRECIALKACLSECGANAALIDEPEAQNMAMVLKWLAPIDHLHDAVLRVIRLCLTQVAIEGLAVMRNMLLMDMAGDLTLFNMLIDAVATVASMVSNAVTITCIGSMHLTRQQCAACTCW
jgi:ferredoxin